MWRRISLKASIGSAPKKVSREMRGGGLHRRKPSSQGGSYETKPDAVKPEEYCSSSSPPSFANLESREPRGLIASLLQGGVYHCATIGVYPRSQAREHCGTGSLGHDVLRIPSLMGNHLRVEKGKNDNKQERANSAPPTRHRQQSRNR